MATVDNLFYIDYEPKTKNRFIFQIEGIDAFLVKSGNRPSLESSRKEIDFINTKRYVAGKYTWSTLDITFQDPIVPSGAQKVIEWVREHHEFSTGISGYKSAYRREITLNMLGPDGTKVEEWKLVGAFIQSVTFGDLDYSSDDLSDVQVTLSYDYAILNY